MTYNQFLNMDEAGQFEAICDGEFLAQLMLDQIKIRLYCLDELYVEVYYDVQDNFIQRFVPLTTQDRSVALMAYITLN